MNTRYVASAVLALALVSAAAEAADWPFYLGPNRNNVSAETDLKLWAGDAAKILWKRNVGTGHSSVVVFGKNLYTQGGGAISCLDAQTGELVWRHPAGDAPPAGDAKGKGKGRGKGTENTATPAVADGMVYALNHDQTLLCLDAAKGQVVWSKRVDGFGVKRGGWALSGSPLVVDDKVVMDLGVVFALNRKTGELVWKAGTQAAGYASAVVFSRGQDRLVTSFNADGLNLYNLADGKAVAGFPWKTSYNVNAASPLIAGDRIFISGGYGRGGALVQLDGDTLKKVWENKEMAKHCQTGVLLDGCLYGVHGQQGSAGSIKCMDLATGQVKWEQKGSRVGGGLTLADKKLFVLADGGELLVAEASPQAYKQLARAKVLDGQCWTAPVVAGARAYCRSHDGDLACVDLR